MAKRLFEWELRADWDTFYGAVEKYSRILGEKGLAAYRRLAEAEWARVPARSPGRDDAHQYGRRFRIARIVEALARKTGDVEAVVAVKKRDLSLPYSYRRLRKRTSKPAKTTWRSTGQGAVSKRSPNDQTRAFVSFSRRSITVASDTTTRWRSSGQSSRDGRIWINIAS